jgi:hypothetical protein
MKFLKIISALGAIILIFFIFQSFIMSSSDIEQYPYEVVKKYDDFEIRKYESRKFAYVEMPSDSYKRSSNNGFRMLAGYIFGGNEENQKIAMTSPVKMDMEDSVTMMFMVPDKYEIDDLPTPNNQKVRFKTEPEKVVAAISFGGWANDQKIEKYSQKLASLLDKNGIKHANTFSYLGYNPPYEIFNRRNEIIVEVMM